MQKVLLHACCGICSGYPIQKLKELGVKEKDVEIQRFKGLNHYKN